MAFAQRRVTRVILKNRLVRVGSQGEAERAIAEIAGRHQLEVVLALLGCLPSVAGAHPLGMLMALVIVQAEQRRMAREAAN